MHGTVDSIFTLKMLIDKYVKFKPQKHRHLLFSCFVDSRKAFDCIPRQKLLDKLRKEGVQGRFLDVLISMYSNDQSTLIKIDNKLTQSFTCWGKARLTMKLFDALISAILFYASEVWEIDFNRQLEKDPAELLQNKFLKWLLEVKYCNNNACRAETGRFPMRIEVQCRNFKFWLTLTKNENKLSQIAYNDIK